MQIENTAFAITDHAKKRLKERLGIKYTSANRHIQKIISCGDFLRTNEKDKIYIIYNDVKYLFKISTNKFTNMTQIVLLTVLTSNITSLRCYYHGDIKNIAYRSRFWVNPPLPKGRGGFTN